MKKMTGYIAFTLLFLLAVVLGVATWQEHLHGTDFVMHHFYKTTWFNLLWAWLAFTGGYYMIQTGLYKKRSVMALHFALLVIFAGAMITRFNGKTGTIHLREGVQTDFFACQELNNRSKLPFLLELKTFRIEYYPGTSSPSNYVSIVKVDDLFSGKSFDQEISMNQILKYKGYRFYQSSFDEDMKGSLLSVNRDTTGIAFTYAGYFLLFLSMLWVLFDKKGRFSELCRRNFSQNKNRSLIILLFLLSVPVFSSAKESAGLQKMTIDREQADQLGHTWVNYQGRICPLQTMASDFTLKLTGKLRYQDLSACQFLSGWIFFSEDWQHIPLFEIKHPELRALIDSRGKACLNDFFDERGIYKLMPYWREMYGSDHRSAFLKEAAKLDEKIQLITMLRNGSLLKIFPLVTEENRIEWFSPGEQLPENIGEMEQSLVAGFFSSYKGDVRGGDVDSAQSLLALLQKFQQKSAGSVLPSEIHLKAELLYNRYPVFSVLFMACLTIGCIGVFFFIFNTIKNKGSGKIHSILYISLILLFLILTLWIALRGYIAGRLPMSNGYETMLFIAWTALLVGILLRRSFFLITVFSILLAGFTLLVAHIGSMNPGITPLVPVLQSPLLSIHVSLIMIAYGLCGFMLFNSLTTFVLLIFSGKKGMRQVEELKEMSELFMFPATFLMGAGIFVGAIWANVSWGRYWGWDPKEVWALVTFILMSFSFHGKTIPWFRKPVFYHIFVVILFLSVLMTYFGVNYILGGKHSYAG